MEDLSRKLKDAVKNRKLFELLDALELNQGSYLTSIRVFQMGVDPLELV